VDAALQKLYRQAHASKDLAKGAKVVLVFPNVVNGGGNGEELPLRFVYAIILGTMMMSLYVPSRKFT
jgi:hypothetical protein